MGGRRKKKKRGLGREGREITGGGEGGRREGGWRSTRALVRCTLWTSCLIPSLRVSFPEGRVLCFSLHSLLTTSGLSHSQCLLEGAESAEGGRRTSHAMAHTFHATIAQ